MPIDDAALDVLEEQIRGKLETLTGFASVEARQLKMTRIFKKVDKDKSGKLTLKEFEAAMASLCFTGVKTQLAKLFERYDEEDDGTVSYEEFIKRVLGINNNPKGDALSRSLIERVRAQIIARGGANGIRTIGRIFRIMDDNGSKTLNYEEFRLGLGDMGVRNIPDEDFQRLCKIFDKNNDGNIGFDEFLRACRGKMSQKRKHFIYYAFDLLDKDGNGFLTVEDLQGRYDVSKHPDVLEGRMTEEEALVDFAKQWDDENAPDGKVTPKEFLEYYKDVSASIDRDDYFELMMRNAWHISGGEGASANTSCLRVLVIHDDNSQTVEEVQDDLGLDKSDIANIIKRLESQGITDIKKISLADAM
jgi:Ca2+-binding EF-hand superfamily protein